MFVSVFLTTNEKEDEVRTLYFKWFFDQQLKEQDTFIDDIAWSILAKHFHRWCMELRLQSSWHSFSKTFTTISCFIAWKFLYLHRKWYNQFSSFITKHTRRKFRKLLTKNEFRIIMIKSIVWSKDNGGWEFLLKRKYCFWLINDDKLNKTYCSGRIFPDQYSLISIFVHRRLKYKSHRWSLTF